MTTTDLLDAANAFVLAHELGRRAYLHLAQENQDLPQPDPWTLWVWWG